jgi:hypothetical protein
MATPASAGELEALGGRRVLLQVPALLVRPRRTLSNLVRVDRPTWLAPLLVISVCALLYVGASGWVRQRASLSGQDPLPPDFQWYTPSQQAQYLRALEATRSPTFVYLLPGLATLAQVWLGWLITGGVLHMGSTVLGGRSGSASVLSIAAWAGLPFAVRFLVRSGFVLASGHAIEAAGLSGFGAESARGEALFLRELLALLDVYLIWHIGLLAAGMAALGGMSRGKIAASVALTEIVALLVQAVPATIFSSLAGLTIIRPFFF